MTQKEQQAAVQDPMRRTVLTHTAHEDFEHFLSYSGLWDEPEAVLQKLWKAFVAAIPNGSFLPDDPAAVGDAPYVREGGFAAVQAQGDTLHDQIMNLRCDPLPENTNADPQMAYRLGHRDARHAAAELIAALQSPPVSDGVATISGKLQQALQELFDADDQDDHGEGNRATTRFNSAMNSLRALSQPPAASQGQWVRCTPDLINAGVSCDATPRRPGDGTYSHDHFIAHGSQPSAVEAPSELPPLPDFKYACEAGPVFTVEDMENYARAAIAALPAPLPKAEAASGLYHRAVAYLRAEVDHISDSDISALCWLIAPSAAQPATKQGATPSPDQQAVLTDFRQYMETEAIPAIVERIRRRNEAANAMADVPLTTAAQPAQGTQAVPNFAQIELWFFRDLVDADRLKLFKLCGLVTEDVTEHHLNLGLESKLFKAIFAAPKPPAVRDGGAK